MKVCLLGLALFFSGLSANPARADGQEFCNETSFILYTALAFPDQTSLVSEGWTRLRPGDCRTVLPAPVPHGEYFVFAHSSPAHRGGVRQWDGPTKLCVDKADFSVSGMANCEALGLDSRGFQAIDANAPNGRKTIFIEISEYKDRASLAGLQRLLIDNGLKVRKIDGYVGRRTRIAIDKYLKRHKIKTRPTDAELFDLLEKSAQEVVTEIGLEVCNQADTGIWAAYAKGNNKQWETRGWWSVGPGACVQLLSDELKKRNKYYLYAGLRNTKAETPLAQATEIFCVTEVKFSIFGRQNCEKRGYLQSKFIKVEMQKGPLTRVTLTQKDFDDKNTSGFAKP